MKYLYFVALAAVFACVASGQTLSEPSGLAIVKKQWRMTPVVPANSVLLEDPFDAIEKSNRAARQPATQAKRNKDSFRQEAPKPETTEPPARSETTLKTTMSYSYELRVRNDNDKTIRHVFWDYVFFDQDTKDEVGRHRFNSRVNIKPGKTETMNSKLVSPPTGAVDARNTGKKASEQYIEQIIIWKVEFADGSNWRPLTPN